MEDPLATVVLLHDIYVVFRIDTTQGMMLILIPYSTHPRYRYGISVSYLSNRDTFTVDCDYVSMILFKPFAARYDTMVCKMDLPNAN